MLCECVCGVSVCGVSVCGVCVTGCVYSLYQSLQTKPLMVRQTGQRPLPTIYFPVHYLFDAGLRKLCHKEVEQ